MILAMVHVNGDSYPRLYNVSKLMFSIIIDKSMLLAMRQFDWLFVVWLTSLDRHYEMPNICFNCCNHNPNLIFDFNMTTECNLSLDLLLAWVARWMAQWKHRFYLSGHPRFTLLIFFFNISQSLSCWLLHLLC